MAHSGGLSNLGGTCYLNSILQVLRSTNIFSPQQPQTSELVKNIQAVFASVVDGHTVAPHTLISHMQTIAGPHFQLRRANDLHEFFVALIDWITRSQNEPCAAPRCVRNTAARAAWSACLKGNGSALTPRFYGLIRKNVQCGLCNARYVNFETFSALTIDLVPGSGPVALQTLLGAAFAERDLNADGGTWKCDKCGVVGGAALSSSSFEHSPDVFAIAFNRYAGPHCKRGVTFPLTFNIALHSTTKTYHCAGAAMHVGGATGGHCYAATPRASDGRWAIYDDDIVRDVGDPPLGSPHIHMLVYTL